MSVDSPSLLSLILWALGTLKWRHHHSSGKQPPSMWREDHPLVYNHISLSFHLLFLSFCVFCWFPYSMFAAICPWCVSIFFLHVIPLIISADLLYSCCSWLVFVLVSFYIRNLVVFKFFYMGFVLLLIPFGKLVVGCVIFGSWYCFVLFELFLNCFWVLLAVLEVTHPFYVHFLHYKS